jgi:hypothetical protein
MKIETGGLNPLLSTIGFSRPVKGARSCDKPDEQHLGLTP